MGPAEYFELSSDDGWPAGGKRPVALLEPRPRERDRRHTGVGYEIAQNLEVPVPQMGEQLPDVLQFFASFLPGVAEQVLEVPKIFLDTTPQRLGDHLRQPADGGTVGACADCRVLFFAPAAYCRADRRHSSSRL